MTPRSLKRFLQVALLCVLLSPVTSSGWGTAGSTYAFWTLPTVRLATTASKAPQHAAWASYDASTSARVKRVTDRALAGRTVPVLAATGETQIVTDTIDVETHDRDWWHQLRQQFGTAIHYEYFARLPQRYGSEPSQAWPIIFYLHGSGGGDPDVWPAVRENEGPQYLAQMEKNFPFIVVSLRSSGGWYPPAVQDVMDAVERKYRVDPTRRYLTGFSMGGVGTWSVAYDQPDRFAAIAPVGGLKGDPARAEQLRSVGVWVFNGANDRVTPAAEARAAVSALQLAGVDVQYTEIPNAGHGESLTIAYRNPALYSWFLSHHRSQIKTKNAASFQHVVHTNTHRDI